ncbi:MAG: C39 family peptidase [Clostridiales bacterium]|nr:C39 family peptidase [Clostridiales bacterium]
MSKRRAAWLALAALFSYLSIKSGEGFLSALDEARRPKLYISLTPTPVPTPIPLSLLEVFSQGELKGTYSTYQEALDQAKSLPDSGVWKDGWVWDNRLPYASVTNDNILFFGDLSEASLQGGQIYLRRQSRLLWDDSPLPEEAKLQAPVVLQYPELARGCEVSSLSMLLKSQGIDIGKMELAEKISKDATIYRSRKGVVTFGDPNLGFVGSMDNPRLDGYGVYDKPIFDLLKKYMPDRGINLTSCEFESLKKLLAQGSPVWIITNSTFAPLKEEEFVFWNIPSGRLKATYKEHSVLLTGYDKHTAYFNDPLQGPSQADLERFREAWEQMGSQAVSVAPE